jgi:hypothetical protein
MGKKQFNRQYSYEDAQDAIENYEDDHYNDFCDLLFNQLLINIQRIKFDCIIQNYLLGPADPVYKTEQANSLFWLYRADRKLIDSKTVYSFRFANACHPEFYKSFETKAHHLFLPITEKRHKSYGWYKYIGEDLPNLIDKFLNIRRVVENHYPHKTKLFINQKQERLDIQFNFYSINERIAINFEPGYPATGQID